MSSEAACPTLLEDRRDLCLGLGQLAELDEHASFLQALLPLDRRFHCLRSHSRSRVATSRLLIEGRGRSLDCQADVRAVSALSN